MDKKQVMRYYDSDIIGQKYGLPGTGVIGLLLGEHLHPPMVDDPTIWSNGKLWKKGAEMVVRTLADMAHIEEGNKVLDVGCGVGGPSRLLSSEYCAEVVGINVSKLQIQTANQRTKSNQRQLIDFVVGDGQHIPFLNETFDRIFCLNMFYHIYDKEVAVNEFHRVLRKNGQVAFDDWVITSKTSEDEHKKLCSIWENPDFGSIEKYLGYFRNTGFEITNLVDVSNIGRGIMAEYFDTTFESYFRRKIERSDRRYGKMIADDFKHAVLTTIGFYIDGKFGYYRFVAKKHN